MPKVNGEQNMLVAIKRCMITAQKLDDSIVELLQTKNKAISYAIALFASLVCLLGYMIFFRTSDRVEIIKSTDIYLPNPPKQEYVSPSLDENIKNLDLVPLQIRKNQNQNQRQENLSIAIPINFNKAVRATKMDQPLSNKYLEEKKCISPFDSFKYNATIYQAKASPKKDISTLKPFATRGNKLAGSIFSPENSSTPKKKISAPSSSLDDVIKKPISTKNILADLDDLNFDVTDTTMISKRDDVDTKVNETEKIENIDRKTEEKAKKKEHTFKDIDVTEKSLSLFSASLSQKEIAENVALKVIENEKENKRPNLLNPNVKVSPHGMSKNKTNFQFNSPPLVPHIAPINMANNWNMMHSTNGMIKTMNPMGMMNPMNQMPSLNVINQSPHIHPIAQMPPISHIQNLPPINPMGAMSPPMQFQDVNNGYPNTPVFASPIYLKSIWNDFNNTNKNGY